MRVSIVRCVTSTGKGRLFRCNCAYRIALRKTDKQKFGPIEGTRRVMAVQQKRFCPLNCDNTYDLKIMEEVLLEKDEKGKFKFHVDSLYFGLRQMTEMVETTLPTLKMDFAIFVVHANESRLSINEDNAGIGYARLYKLSDRNPFNLW